MIRLSLIIATYNRASQLISALESVVLQEAPSDAWECIVVNNNSKDDTVERFAAFAACYPSLNLKIVTETSQGLSFARNRGIAESCGEYIAIIDDDERINTRFISSYIDFFTSYPDAVAAGGRIIPEYPSGRPAWMSRYTERPIANPIWLGDVVRRFPAGVVPGGGNMAVRRSAIECYGTFNTSLGRVGSKLTGGEETEFFDRLKSAGESFWYVPGAVMWHIIPPQKLTVEYFDKLCFNIGVSQTVRAAINGRTVQLWTMECFKWAATLGLAIGFACGLTPTKAVYLLRMRRSISAGIFNRKE